MPDDDARQKIEQQPTQERPIEQTGPLPDPLTRQPAQAIANQDVQREVEDVEERIGRAERSMIRLTAAIAFFALCSVIVGILQWSAMRGQLGEMKNGGVDTHNLAIAARTQAEAAKSTAETAATALKSSITSFRQQVRPYIVIETTRVNQAPKEGAILGVESVMRNTGTTPALHMRIGHTFIFQNVLPCGFAAVIPLDAGVIDIGSSLVRAVRIFGQRPLTSEEVSDITLGRRYVCYSLVVQYEDIFRDIHTSKACSYYRPQSPGTAVGEGDLFLHACPQQDYNKVE